MIRAHSDKDAAHEQEVSQAIMQYKVGGLCFFQGTPEKQAYLTNDWQNLTTHVPLMISMDAEWGLNMRLKDACIGFPRQLMLGAIQDNRLIYDMGYEIGRECRRLGVHVNFAPVADVNNNPNNPVINDRSFGEDRINVAAKSYAYMQGMQDAGVMACAKHFPGHGDTDVDSHLDLPVIYHPRQRLDSMELMPFRVLTEHGVGSVMVAHLQVPAIDARENTPTTLSSLTIEGILRNDLGYTGLVFTDAMEMKGVTKYYSAGEAAAKALEAGNDVVLLPDNLPMAIQAIKQYIEEGKITPEHIERSVKRVLIAKYRLALHQSQLVQTFNVRDDINTTQAYALKRRLIQSALTLVRDTAHLIPLNNGPTKYAVIVLGKSHPTGFQNYFGSYGAMQSINLPRNPTPADCEKAIADAQQSDVVVVALMGLSRLSKDNFGLTDHEINLIYQLNGSKKLVLVNFGSPYVLRFFDGVGSVLQAYNDDPMTQEVTPQAMFGVFPMTGKLPVSASSISTRQTGIDNRVVDRLRFDAPESVGMSSEILKRIDYLAQEAIDKRATPGCQVLIARRGTVVFQKAYGFTTYEQTIPVTTNHVYDLASITKVVATTSAIMKLHDNGIIDINKPLGDYLGCVRGTNKQDVLVRDVLLHQAGLQAWIPFYKETLFRDANEVCVHPDLYSSDKRAGYEVPVAQNLYIANSWPDSIRQKIVETMLGHKGTYKYSDLGMYLLADLIHEQTGMPLDEYVRTQFYAPLGMDMTGFNPWMWLPDSLYVPTEEDNYFRMKLVSGYVHDMGAAMMGGVSGHAGLFSTTGDLAIWAQMLLNKGVYAGQQYISAETVNMFTSRQGGSTRRGLGFDMKELGAGKSANMSVKAGRNTFGHTGFTGNCVWIDPDQELVVVFLSNRTYPTMDNDKLIKGDYRPRLQAIVYDALKN
jgi:beta-glucosidase-like glycosyl hydrolase/CubicO group peptidase (beta-lactamase class C family)